MFKGGSARRQAGVLTIAPLLVSLITAQTAWCIPGKNSANSETKSSQTSQKSGSHRLLFGQIKRQGPNSGNSVYSTSKTNAGDRQLQESRNLGARIFPEIKVPVYVWHKQGVTPHAILAGLHGGCMFGGSYNALGSALAEKGYLTVAADMHGYGQSFH
ncbi:MAG TPA: hypothetical protein VFC63_21995, partial [Blastocatellia bacterium]|nr:hypothetical protein [Blastocatellia bacterium]